MSTPLRAASTATRPTQPITTPARSNSQSRSQGRPPSSSREQQFANVQRRDWENSAVSRPNTSRRSDSNDRSYTAQPPPSRQDSTRRSGSRPSRYTAEPPPGYSNEMPPQPMPTASHGAMEDRNLPPLQPSATKRRTTITGASGQWSLGKTIGAGSMGKVKLAKKMDTGEQVAVKIVPRQTPDDGHHSARERDRQDHSKEIRTAREAAIVSLLDHPYICGMRDVVRTNYHWYMLFEYVNGGQMLDFIISHGKLKEKQARKFGRQISSALDYCHRNSIVHRDLKIENILISKTGDIKIIDFGLSNLFSPKNHLKTFCGSLYFAAPELLQARQYTGPEVDVWSFGIVLYVLVCGKVPFDDQSMPQLHAKIKKGVVDYPQWLSAECRHLISRMLVTEPRNRASLHEIMNHPWMTKGFNTAPENYLPHREPIQLPLDYNVIQKMTGFDFGSPEFITDQLTKVIQSEEYQSAVQLAARESSFAASSAEKRRGFGFDFYKRRNSQTSREGLTNPSAEALHLGTDPVNAYNPLLSIYYLVREKQERERLEESPGALAMPVSAGEQPIKIPGLPAPEAAHTNSATYEIPGEAATGGRARPRARTHGEDEIAESMEKLKVKPGSSHNTPAIVMPPMDSPVMKKESAAAGLLRRFSTRKYRDPAKEKPRPEKPSPSGQLQPPSTDLSATPKRGFSVRRTRGREGPPISMLQGAVSQPQHQDLLSPPDTSSGGRSKLLGRSTSVNSADLRRRLGRRGIPDSPSTMPEQPPPTSGSDRSGVEIITPLTDTESRRDGEPESSLSARGPASRTKSLGHARRESIQARRRRREETRNNTHLLPEERDETGNATGGSGGEEGGTGVEATEHVKPVYLKGLFSVSTTSTKPLSFIRDDIIRVLRQLNVEYSEIKGGFSCRHKPSIDLATVDDEHHPSPDNVPPMPGHRRRFSFMSGADREREQRDNARESEKVPAGTIPLQPPPSRRTHDTSLTNSDTSVEYNHRDGSTPRAVGETSTHVQSEKGGSMILNFEIIIVKVPLFSFHGIQFKKLSGGTWQYKNMADKILKELRL